MTKTIIITDLDGSLLDPHTYSYEHAIPVIEELKRLDIPVVFCSSKTRLEQELYRTRLGLYHPFIVENGGALFIPKDYFHDIECSRVYHGYCVIEFGLGIKELLGKAGSVFRKYSGSIKTCIDMTPEEFMEITGLPRFEAVLALEREYSICFKPLDDSILDSIIADFNSIGLRVSTGGGYIYMVSSCFDKGIAVKKLIDLYRREYGDIVSIGIGDGYNDIPLLRVVDKPVLLGGDKSIVREIGRDNLLIIEEKGSRGWSIAVKKLLSLT